MTEQGPAPVHRKNQAKFPALDSSTLVGLEQQECIANSHRVDPCFSFTPFSEKQGEGRTLSFIASWLVKGTAMPSWADSP